MQTPKRANDESTTMPQNRKKAKADSSSDAQVFRNWNDLDRNLKLEVLARARLPFKELATLRAVSREFSSLLSDPSFATLYEAYPPPKQTMFFVNSLRFDLSYDTLFHPDHAETDGMYRSRDRSARESIFSFHDETDQTSNWTCCLQGPPLLSLMASNDGFLCFFGHRESKPAIFVCNPMIPGVWAILTIEYGGPELYPEYGGPEWYPETSDCLIGIGFDRKLGAGKIVLCGRLENSEEEITRTLVYNGKKDTWRKVSDINDTLVPAYMNDPFVFKGNFCWVVRSKKQGRQMVMPFNVENEAWEQPILLDQEWFDPPYFIEFEKQLCLLRKDETSILQVWKLDIDARSVTFVQNVELPFEGIYEDDLYADLHYADYWFGGEDVLYAELQHELWVSKIIDGNWHRAVRCRTDRFDSGDWICKVRLFKPSLFRFHAGGQASDCCR